MGCVGRSRKRETMDREEDGDLAEKSGIVKGPCPLLGTLQAAELINGGGIGKESRKGTELWHGYIGKEVVERPLGRESMTLAVSSQRL